jgi:hypothetical protein
LMSPGLFLVPVQITLSKTLLINTKVSLVVNPLITTGSRLADAFIPVSFGL